MTAGVGSWRIAPSSTDHGRGHAPQARHQNAQLLALAQQALEARAPLGLRATLARHHERLDRAALRLQLLDPALVLQRGYAWLADTDGVPITRAAQLEQGQPVRAELSDGGAWLKVEALGTSPRPTRRP